MELANNFMETSGRCRALQFTKEKVRSRREAVILEKMFSVTNVLTLQMDGVIDNTGHALLFIIWYC